MHADALPSSHAVIQQHHGDLRSIIESFDVITYGKGASVLRMLCDYLGVDAFLGGVRRFVTTFQFRNACMTDLWAALEAHCGTDVSGLMEPWLTRAGVPALHVDVWRGESHEGYRLILSQRPLRMGSPAPSPGAAPPPEPEGPIDPSRQRCLPLRLRLGRETGYTLNLLVGETAPLVIDLSPYLSGGAAGQQGGVEPWMVVNSNHAGYFATMYDSPLAWSMARAAVTAGHTCDTEAVGLVCDLMLATQAILKAPPSPSDTEAEAMPTTATLPTEAAGGTPRCPRKRRISLLQTRLQDLVSLWRSDAAPNGVPAWLVGQLFLWEVKMLSLGREVEVAERRYHGVEETAFGWAHPPTDPPRRPSPPHDPSSPDQEEGHQRTAAAMSVAHEVLSEVSSVCQAVESLLSSPSHAPLAPLLSEHLIKAKAVRSRLLAITSRLTSAAACHPRLSPPLAPAPPCAVHDPSHPLTISTHRSPTACQTLPNPLKQLDTPTARPAALEALAQAACAEPSSSASSSPPTPPYPSTHPSRVYT